ncbi:hypothetical protein BGZ82_004156 [Podila clonocystis]|nr:hypothetical protein BGZ82_004156 [Podila clonocystis]
MDSNVKQQAKKVIDTLYGWLFDGEGYTAPAPAGQCVKEYVDGDEVTSGSIINRVLGSLGNAKGRYASLQDHAIAVVTSAASAVSTIVAKHDHIGAATTGIPGQGHIPRPSSTFFDNGRVTSNSDSLISFFRSFYDNPSAAFDDLLGHHYPHFDSLITSLGLDKLAKSLNCDSRILFLACLLPLIVLLLSTCCIMGAGYSTEEPHGPGYHEHKKSDPTLVGGKSEGQGLSSSASSHGAGSSSGSSTSSAKGGKGKGKKGGAPRDDAGGPVIERSAPAGTYHLGNSNLSSWGSMLGATGFCGADVLDFKPFDIYDIIGSTKAQRDQDEVILDNQDDHVENISDFPQEFISAATQAKKFVHDINEINTDNAPQKTLSQADTKGKQGGPAGPGSEPQLRARIPRPRSFKEADRHRHQPHIPSSSFASSSSTSSRQRQGGFGNVVDQGHGDQHESIAAKIMNFAQGNSVMKNLDGISGGVLGATLAIVAALTNTAEAATTSLKENIPNSVSDFVNELQESFDEAMENGGLEGTGFDDQPRVSRVQITELPDKASISKKADGGSSVSPTSKTTSSTGSSKSWPSTYGPMANKNSKATPASSTPSTSAKAKTGSTGTSNQVNMAANPPRLRQRSVGHAQPEMHVAASSSINSVRPAQAAHTPSTEDLSCGPVIHHATPTPVSVPAPVFTPKAATSSSQFHMSSRLQGNSSIEDISVGPKTKHAVYAEYVGQEPSESAAAESSLAIEDLSGSGLDKGTKSTKHTYGASGPYAEEEPKDPKEIAHRAKMGAEVEEKGHKSGSSMSSVATSFSQKPVEIVAHASDKVSNGVKTAASKAKNQAKYAEGSIETAAKDMKKNADKAVGKSKDSVGFSIPSAQKAKDTIIHDTKEKVKDADATAKKVASNAKKTVEAGVSYAQKAKNTLIKDAQAVVHGAETSAQKTKDAAVAQAKKLAEEAEHAAEAVVGQAKAIANSAVETVQYAADVAVHTAQDKVLQADIALHDVADAAQKSMRRASDATHRVADQTKAVVGSTIAVAKHDIEEAEHLAKEAVTSTLSAAQRTKDSVAHAAEDAVHEAEAILDSAVKQGHDNVGAFLTGTHAVADKVVADAKGTLKNAERNAETAAKNAEKNIEATVASAQQVKNTLIADATKAANKASKDAKKAVDSASGAVHKAEKNIESVAQKAKNNASHVAKDVEKKVESTAKAASATAQKVKDNATQAVKDAEKKAEDTVQTATAAAQKAKESATQAAKDIHTRAESAVDSAFNAALMAKFDASHVAKEVEKSVVSAKKTIGHGMQAVSSSAQKAKITSTKDLNKTANKAGQSDKVKEEDVQATIKAAMEYALKTTNDGPIQSAKATLNSAIASAHKTESHIAQNLKNVAHKAESVAHKASGNAKAALDSALAAAHKAENNHADARSVHLDAPSPAFSYSAPAHLHHAEHTHDIKKAFIYGHNSPRVGNKETRFVAGSPPSNLSSDPKPELKAAHIAHHAHHDGAAGDGTHKKLQAASDNHNGGEYRFFLDENDLLDDANADDGGEEDSDEDDHHDQPGHGGHGILSAAPSILQSAKTAASAVAARVADASHQRLDNARHRLSSIVDHMADNVAGHDELDDDDIDDEDDGHDSTSRTMKWSTPSGLRTLGTHHHHHQSHIQVHPHHHVTVEDATDSLSDVADSVSEMIHGAKNYISEAAKDVKALAKDAAKSISHHGADSSKIHIVQSAHIKNHGDSKDKAQKDSEGLPSYKPSLSSTHVDKDRFIAVEAPDNALAHKIEHHGPAGQHRHHTSSSSSSAKKHSTTADPPPTKSHSASSQPSGTTKSKKNSAPSTGLSYSGVVQLHVNKNDHGPQLGITENRSTKPASNSLFQNENYEQFRVTAPSGDEIASVISHGGDQIMPVTLNPPPTAAHKGHQHHHHHQKHAPVYFM